MKEFTVRRYNDNLKGLWDSFISNTEVQSILFYRDFMEYHKKRFDDFSLMIFNGKKLLAVLPANIDNNNEVYSHQGLSYGSVLFLPFTYFTERLIVFYSILRYLNSRDINSLILKSIPKCYSTDTSENIIFGWLKSVNIYNDIYTYIPKGEYSKPNRGRIKSIKNSSKLNFEVKIFYDYSLFWNSLLKPNLRKRFGVEPVHSINQISLLANNFPNQIKLFGAFENDVLRAGIVLFVHDKVSHAQYIAGDEHRKDGVIDFLVDHIINKFNGEFIFSFGSSSEDNGSLINNGLLYWKESFRSQNGIQSYYSIKTNNYKLLKNRLK